MGLRRIFTPPGHPLCFPARYTVDALNLAKGTGNSLSYSNLPWFHFAFRLLPCSGAQRALTQYVNLLRPLPTWKMGNHRWGQLYHALGLGMQNPSPGPRTTPELPYNQCWLEFPLGTHQKNRVSDSGGARRGFRETIHSNTPSCSNSGCQEDILWMGKILHHLETMVDTIVHWYLQGNHYFRGTMGNDSHKHGYRNGHSRVS